MLENTSLNYSLIWNNLRNLVELKDIKVQAAIKLVDTVQGKFPVNAYKPVFIERAKDNYRQHILARSNTFNSYVKWFFSRIIDLPIYEYDENLTEKDMKEIWQKMLKRWYYTNIPENIPSIAIALKAEGNYCEEREAQQLFVIVIWHNKVARIFTLDWYEGPLEDCISPEWYFKSSPLLSIERLFIELKKIMSQLPNWSNQRYSLFLNPDFFGRYLTRMNKKISYNSNWENEWVYNRRENFVDDLDTITRKIVEMSFH